MDNDQSEWLFRWILRPIGLLLMRLRIVRAEGALAPRGRSNDGHR